MATLSNDYLAALEIELHIVQTWAAQLSELTPAQRARSKEAWLVARAAELRVEIANAR